MINRISERDVQTHPEAQMLRLNAIEIALMRKINELVDEVNRLKRNSINEKSL